MSMTRKKGPVSGLTDKEASQIARETYRRNKPEIKVEVGDKVIIHTVIETIEDTDTGLHGYVLENKDTKEITISFEGTQKNLGAAQFSKDLKEDALSIVLGNNQYVELEITEEYTGSGRQKVLLREESSARVENNQLVTERKNQFIEADKVVQRVINEYGAENITFVGHSLGAALAQYFAVKYEASAVTFATPAIYHLLPADQQKKVDRGDYQHMIIDYSYPDDYIHQFRQKTIGSTYYMEVSRTETMLSGSVPFFTQTGSYDSLVTRFLDYATLSKVDEFLETVSAYVLGTIFDHSMTNYSKDEHFDANGYFIPELLYHGELQGVPGMSPLAAKNRSQGGDYQILIQADLMRSYAKRAEEGVERIEDTEKMLRNFWEIYFEEMQGLRQSYDAQVGHGQYDLLDASDVAEIFSSIGIPHQGAHIPILFDLNEYQELIHRTNQLQEDTVEMVSHMHKVSDEFEKRDLTLGESIKIFLFSRWT